MRWLSAHNRFRNIWSEWWPMFAYVPRTCTICLYTVWLDVVYTRIQYVSNYGGAMWLSEFKCSTCRRAEWS